MACLQRASTTQHGGHFHCASVANKKNVIAEVPIAASMHRIKKRITLTLRMLASQPVRYHNTDYDGAHVFQDMLFAGKIKA